MLQSSHGFASIDLLQHLTKLVGFLILYVFLFFSAFGDPHSAATAADRSTAWSLWTRPDRLEHRGSCVALRGRCVLSQPPGVERQDLVAYQVLLSFDHALCIRGLSARPPRRCKHHSASHGRPPIVRSSCQSTFLEEEKTVQSSDFAFLHGHQILCISYVYC